MNTSSKTMVLLLKSSSLVMTCPPVVRGPLAPAWTKQSSTQGSTWRNIKKKTDSNKYALTTPYALKDIKRANMNQHRTPSIPPARIASPVLVAQDTCESKDVDVVPLRKVAKWVKIDSWVPLFGDENTTSSRSKSRSLHQIRLQTLRCGSALRGPEA